MVNPWVGSEKKRDVMPVPEVLSLSLPPLRKEWQLYMLSAPSAASSPRSPWGWLGMQKIVLILCCDQSISKSEKRSCSWQAAGEGFRQVSQFHEMGITFFVL